MKAIQIILGLVVPSAGLAFETTCFALYLSFAPMLLTGKAFQTDEGWLSRHAQVEPWVPVVIEGESVSARWIRIEHFYHVQRFRQVRSADGLVDLDVSSSEVTPREGMVALGWAMRLLGLPVIWLWYKLLGLLFRWLRSRRAKPMAPQIA